MLALALGLGFASPFVAAGCGEDDGSPAPTGPTNPAAPGTGDEPAKTVTDQSTETDTAGGG